LLFLLSLIPAFAYIKEGELYELIGPSIEDFQKEFHGELRVICFYVPFSQEYTRFSSAYFHAAKELAKQKLPLKLAKIDATNPKNAEYIKKYEVGGYPAIVYFPAEIDEFYHYAGDRRKEAFIASFKEKTLKLREFADTDAFDKYMTENGLHGLVLGVFQEFSGSKYEVFRETAKNLVHLYPFAVVKDKGEWFAKFDISEEGILILRPQFLIGPKDNAAIANHKLENSTTIEEWVKLNYHPHISYLTKETKASFSQSQAPFVMFLFNLDPTQPEVIKQNLMDFHESANPYYNANFKDRRFLFVLADKKEFNKGLEPIDLDKDKAIILTVMRDNRFVLREYEIFNDNGKFLKLNVDAYIKGLETNSLIPYVKSETTDVKSENGIKILIANEFEDKVVNTEINQIIFTYSKHDRLSQPTLQILEDVAFHYKDDHNLEFLKIDADLNELKGEYNKPHLPNIFIVHKENKRVPNRFVEAEITKEKLIKFIEDEFTPKKEDL